MIGSLKKLLRRPTDAAASEATNDDGVVDRDDPLSPADERWVAGFLADYQSDRLEIRLRPSSSVRIMKILDDPRSNATRLAEAIQTDPGLTASLLKLANSPLFGKTSMPLGIEQAVVRVGKKQLKGLMLSVLLGQQVSKGPLVDDLGRLAWRHSLVCAKLASMLAPQRKGIPDAAFVTGLFHDVGVFALLNTVQDREKKSFRRKGPTPRAILEVLIRVAPEVNGRVIADWELPGFVVRAITRPWVPDQAPHSATPLSALIALCNDLCAEHGLPIDPIPEVRPKVHPALKVLGKKSSSLPSATEIAAMAAQASQL